MAPPGPRRGRHGSGRLLLRRRQRAEQLRAWLRPPRSGTCRDSPLLARDGRIRRRFARRARGLVLAPGLERNDRDHRAAAVIGSPLRRRAFIVLFDSTPPDVKKSRAAHETEPGYPGELIPVRPIAQDRFDLAGGLADDLAGFAGGIVRRPARDLAAVGPGSSRLRRARSPHAPRGHRSAAGSCRA